MRSPAARRARALVAVLLVTVVMVGTVALTAVSASADSGSGERARDERSSDDSVRTRGPRPVTTFESVVLALDGLRSRAESADAARRAAQQVPCAETGKGGVPHLVAAIFRCRLRRAGWAERDVERVAAEAVVVARCESVWDPDAVVFDGRYKDTPHPNGNRYSAAGVFQFIRKTADRWIEGGYANVTDPRLNIDAAARLYLHNHRRGYPGWSDWACVAVNDGFKEASVLPGWPGGPKRLPKWSKRY